MKLPLILILNLSFFTKGLSQSENNTLFDFWVGHWECTWKLGESEGKGINTIVKILDGKVIQEFFKAKEGSIAGFDGTSISVYNPTTKSWHQAWADNQGGYINLIGQVDGDKRIFITPHPKINASGDKMINRMVFHDITHKNFIWDWEYSTDEGKTWTLSWRIFYTRIE
ncbi:MAG: hypothetical protein OEY34_03950 [Cyclobacteriaceae bacterium]|nr:hypothetical protein [Cyclobacteriaceae bacterium]